MKRCPCGSPAATPQQNPKAAAAGKCVACYEIGLYIDYCLKNPQKCEEKAKEPS